MIPFTFNLLSTTIVQHSVLALLNSFIEYLQTLIEHISCSDNYSICWNYLGHWSGEKEAST